MSPVVALIAVLLAKRQTEVTIMVIKNVKCIMLPVQTVEKKLKFLFNPVVISPYIAVTASAHAITGKPFN